jgi:hypothetical protein
VIFHGLFRRRRRKDWRLACSSKKENVLVALASVPANGAKGSGNGRSVVVVVVAVAIRAQHHVALVFMMPSGSPPYPLRPTRRATAGPLQPAHVDRRLVHPSVVVLGADPSWWWSGPPPATPAAVRSCGVAYQHRISNCDVKIRYVVNHYPIGPSPARSCSIIFLHDPTAAAGAAPPQWLVSVVYSSASAVEESFSNNLSLAVRDSLPPL